MEILRIKAKKLEGDIAAPLSKSVAIRSLLCSYLYGGEKISLENLPQVEDFCDDVALMKKALAELDKNDGNPAVIECGDSGAVLRFLIPVAAALGRECEFNCSLALSKRPMDPLLEALEEHGATIKKENCKIKLSGKLFSGIYKLPGNISSQYISGLLMAFPLIKGSPEIQLKTELESSGYVDLTQFVLKKKGNVDMEGDWSSAAFWLAANALGSSVNIEGLNLQSLQPDRIAKELFSKLKKCGEAKRPCVINLSQTPDLAPALAAAALGFNNETRLTGCSRLRLKESNRIESIVSMISSLGGSARAVGDEIVIFGTGRVPGGVVNACGDHRIAMAGAIASVISNGTVTIRGAEAVSKSYPEFFSDMKKLGAMVL